MATFLIRVVIAYGMSVLFGAGFVLRLVLIAWALALSFCQVLSFCLLGVVAGGLDGCCVGLLLLVVYCVALLYVGNNISMRMCIMTCSKDKSGIKERKTMDFAHVCPGGFKVFFRPFQCIYNPFKS